MQNRVYSSFAEPQPLLAIVIFITIAKVRKNPETTKLFRHFFQEKTLYFLNTDLSDLTDFFSFGNELS